MFTLGVYESEVVRSDQKKSRAKVHDSNDMFEV